MTPGGPFSGPTTGNLIGYGFGSNQVLFVAPTCIIGTCQGVKPTCPLFSAGISKFNFPTQGCWQYYSGVAPNPSMISDREDVINLHMGIPKHNGLRDDVQVLWSGSALANYFYDSASDIGPGNNQFIWAAFNTIPHAPICGPETIAPGLTVNGCNSPGGAAGRSPRRCIRRRSSAVRTRALRRRTRWAAAQRTRRTQITSRTTRRSARRSRRV